MKKVLIVITALFAALALAGCELLGEEDVYIVQANVYYFDSGAGGLRFNPVAVDNTAMTIEFVHPSLNWQEDVTIVVSFSDGTTTEFTQMLLGNGSSSSFPPAGVYSITRHTR